MKKLLLSLVAIAGCTLALAQPAGEGTSWKASLQPVSSMEAVNINAPIARTAEGIVYATGSFDQTLVFGESFLEPIATSAYLAKYNADGTPAWAVSLAGAATIKTITVAENGEVFIAGQLADKVVFGSTDEATQTLEGYKAADGTYSTHQVAAFIARYDADGVLKAAKAFCPAEDPSWAALGFMDYGGDIKFHINKIQAVGDKLYASCFYTGSTTFDGVKFEGKLSVMDFGGFFYSSALSNVDIFTLSTADLAVTGKSVGVSRTAAEGDAMDCGTDVTFAVEGETLYAAIVGSGRFSITTAAGATAYEAVRAASWGEEVIYNTVLLAINGTDVKAKEFVQPELEQSYKAVLGDMQISGENLYIGGSFNEACPLQPALKSVNKTDLYVATIGKDLEVKSAAASQLDEQLDNKNEEIFGSMGVIGGVPTLNGYVDQMSGHIVLSTQSYYLTADGLTANELTDHVIGIVGNSKAMTYQTVTTEASFAPVWSKEIDGVAAAGDINRTAPVAVTADGIVYATGAFNKELTFGESFLSPIATSAYLAKYNADGTPAWGVSLAGAATIKTITVAENGEVFIAGQLADKVVFGSTDEATQTLEGYKAADGTYSTHQVAAFIARYDANGVLKAAKAFCPAEDPSWAALGFSDWGGDIKFHINKIQAVGDKLYASCFYTGSTTFDGVKFEGKLSVMDFGGFFYSSALSNVDIFTLSTADLAVTGKAVGVSRTAAEGDAMDCGTDVTFAVEGETLYAAIVGSGRFSITTAAGATAYEAVRAASWGEEVIYNTVLLAINGTDVKAKEFVQPELEQSYKAVLGDMQISGENLYIGGSFNEACPLQPALKSVNKTDLYMATIGKDLEVKDAVSSQYDEQLDNKNEEIFTSMAVAENYMEVSGYVDQMSDHTALMALYFQPALGVTATNSGMNNVFTTGLAATGDKFAVNHVIDTKSTVSLQALVEKATIHVISYNYDFEVGVEETTAEVAAPVVQFNGTTLTVNEVAQIAVYGMTGRQVLSANGTAANVSALPAGTYVARVKTATGTATLKFALSK